VVNIVQCCAKRCDGKRMHAKSSGTVRPGNNQVNSSELTEAFAKSVNSACYVYEVISCQDLYQDLYPQVRYYAPYASAASFHT
jgi:hypothetical protein